MDVWTRTPSFGLVFSWLVLVGCDDSTTPNQPPTARFTISPASGPPPLSVALDASASRDADGTVASYQWDFGTGATGSGRTVEHTYTESAAYVVTLTVTDDDGAETSTTGDLVVNFPPTARITADPVDGEAPVTVTFDASESADEDGQIVAYAWDFDGAAEASGVTAEYTFPDPGVYPVRLTVTDDLDGVAEVVFEVNVRDDAGVAFTVPYVPDGAYAEELRPCAYPGSTPSSACTLDRLPFIGMEHSAPTVDDVMARVLVSHRWMGDNFRQVLEQLPEDVRLLARSVTTIVIASDIRPAYYSPGAGAIYLDADFFWRTLEERAVVTRKQDFRSAFGTTIRLYLPWRMVRNNSVLTLSAPPGENRSELPLGFIAFLLYHELSHAADFVRASRLDDIDPVLTPWESSVADYEQWPSTRLAFEHPLRSQVMRDLAGVFFLGADPTPEQEALHADDVIDEFAPDGAVDFYSYSTQYEALADTHDSMLMSYHHGYEKDVGIIAREEGKTRADSIVAWGQRGRMTDPAVIDRARRVVDVIYPGDAQAMHGYLNARPAPLPMRRGDTWAENTVLDGGADFNAAPVASGRLQPSTATGTPKPNLVGCILVPGDAAPELLERLGLK